MRHVTTKSHYSTPILLDQCEVCGGIWVDAHELYKVSYKEIDQLKELDNEIHNDIKKDVPIKKDLKCPTDGTLLIQPPKTLFPTDSGLVVEMCPTCRSVWFNYGELTKHQLHRADFNRQSKEAPTEKESEAINTARRLLAAERSKTTANIKGFGKFLSTPVKGGAIGSTQSLLPIAMLAIREAIQKQEPESSSYDSNKLPESITPAMQKHLSKINPESSYDFSAIHELNMHDKTRKRRNKVKFIYIVFLLLIFSIFITTTYLNNKKDEKMRHYRY
ncbi:MAG: zf-TFIIB domain-containing protein, partial [Candidatus Pacebacteria bacterium]|nr:zf-TFIIB domain-containing protein [Candidatus Paceibacterota bacterium]